VKPIERAGYLAHGRTAAFKRHMEEARSVIRAGFGVAANPYVAYSAGKDSSCLLWLVLEQRLDIAARILTSGETRLLHPDLDDILDWWRVRFPALDLQEILVDRVFTSDWQEATWLEQRKAGRRDIVTYLPTAEFDGVLLGLRSEESKARLMANRRGLMRQYKATRKDALAGTWCICPLANWTMEDIGAFTALHDLPLLSAYDEGLEARTTMRLTGDAARQNALVNLRLRDKVGYNRLVERFPEIVREWGG
jgi:3'-phosphoadenosine 5'-phosphosulfate sulfotransferase (PAPS reductase)/FAD synthetase